MQNSVTKNFFLTLLMVLIGGSNVWAQSSSTSSQKTPTKTPTATQTPPCACDGKGIPGQATPTPPTTPVGQCATPLPTPQNNAPRTGELRTRFNSEISQCVADTTSGASARWSAAQAQLCDASLTAYEKDQRGEPQVVQFAKKNAGNSNNESDDPIIVQFLLACLDGSFGWNCRHGINLDHLLSWIELACNLVGCREGVNCCMDILLVNGKPWPLTPEWCPGVPTPTPTPTPTQTPTRAPIKSSSSSRKSL